MSDSSTSFDEQDDTLRLQANNDSGAARLARFCLRLPLLLLHLFISLPLTLLVLLLSPAPGSGGHAADKAVQWWSAMLCRLFGLRLQQRGEPHAGPVLFVANHVSWADIEVMHAVRACGFIAKAEIAAWPVVGWLAKRGGTIFHQRGSTSSLGQVSEAMRERLDAGRAVAIFPEGRTNDGSALGPFHARLFQAAVDADVPVQAVALLYAGGNRAVAFTEGETFLGSFFRLLGQAPRDVLIDFGEPIAAGGKPRRELAQATRGHIQDVFDHVDAG